jgi:hypothetical protein
VPGAALAEHGVKVLAAAQPQLFAHRFAGWRMDRAGAAQTASRHLPFSMRRFKTAFPFFVLLRCMKP